MEAFKKSNIVSRYLTYSSYAVLGQIKKGEAPYSAKKPRKK
jgi:hypothetical protein